MREPIGVIGIGFVGGHVERRFGVTSIDANGRQSLSAQSMIEPSERGPVSNTTRSAFGARMRISSAMAAGSEAHFPRQIRLPARRIEIAVSFIDTSRPIYSVMAVLH
ncbi:hypothetical protein FHT86_001054 [Rhizobium sp. BK313]|nr:hypothetical protein [Rhizobium sp. BK313]